MYQFYKYLSSPQTVTQYPTSGYPSGGIPLLVRQNMRKKYKLITFSPLLYIGIVYFWGFITPKQRV